MGNTNYLSTSRATLQIQGLPEVEFNITSFNLPDVSVGVVDVPTRFNRGKEAGTNVEFTDLQIEFLVDEDLKNWQTVFEWIVKQSLPVEHDYIGHKNRFSDGSLIIYSSHNNPIKKISLKELFPVSLGGIAFNETDNETVYQKANASFSVLYYEIA